MMRSLRAIYYTLLLCAIFPLTTYAQVDQRLALFESMQGNVLSEVTPVESPASISLSESWSEALSTDSLIHSEPAISSPLYQSSKQHLQKQSHTEKPKKMTLHQAFIPNPKRALLWSIIPGAGQIYNRKYWKIPIIVGAYTACFYAINFNNSNLKEYALAYKDIKSSKPLENNSWIDFIPYGADPKNYVNNTGFQNQLRRGRDFFRHNRDLSIIVTAGVYFLVMLDAYVDAELYNFDISPNLTLSCLPSVMPPTPETPNPSYGLSLALRF